jgi:signal transduction histidine kinase
MIDVQTDPLNELRVAKRWALVGIAVSVALLIPAYALLLGIRIQDILFVVTPAALLGFAAIELGSRWEYRMRRRYAYPHRLGYELAPIHDFRQAASHGAKRLCEWLDVRAVAIGWLSEDGQQIVPVAAGGVSDDWSQAAEPVSLGSSTLRESLEAGRNSRELRLIRDWFGPDEARSRVNLIALVSRDRPEGVIAIASRGGKGIRDERLFASLGMVMGLALENASLYEGQRAHARHMQELNRMKSDFLTTVSHELRTPLTSIMMAAEMLLEEEETRDPTSVRGKLVRSIVKGASRLKSLVSDLVDVSREDEFQPRLELDEAPAGEVVGNAVSIIQPLIAAKHQTFDAIIESGEALVRVDRLRFDQVLINLMSNAQRYSPPGGHVELTVNEEDNEVFFRVRDTGPGVAEEDRNHIFEPFYRGDRSGLGLGLAIAKSLVELHHGRIWVESGEAPGSTFCVALPLHGASRRKRRASQTATAVR